MYVWECESVCVGVRRIRKSRINKKFLSQISQKNLIQKEKEMEILWQEVSSIEMRNLINEVKKEKQIEVRKKIFNYRIKMKLDMIKTDKKEHKNKNKNKNEEDGLDVLES